MRGVLLAGVSGEPLVEGDAEGEELFFAVEGVDHFDVELGALERLVVEAADVVEEVSGECAVGVDGGAGEAEVLVVPGDLLVDGLAVNGDGRYGQREGNSVAGGAFEAEEAALEVVVIGGGDLVVVGGEELNAGIVKRESGIAVVGEDDADGQKAVLDVGKAKEVAVFGVGAGVGGDGDLLAGVGVRGEVLACGFGGRGFFAGGIHGGAGG